MEDKLKRYESPSTKRTVVEPEGPMCAITASGEKSTLKKENKTIEVEEYTEINNSVTFE